MQNDENGSYRGDGRNPSPGQRFVDMKLEVCSVPGPSWAKSVSEGKGNFRQIVQGKKEIVCGVGIAEKGVVPAIGGREISGGIGDESRVRQIWQKKRPPAPSQEKGGEKNTFGGVSRG